MPDPGHPSYFLLTFGCQMNEADSQATALSLEHRGWRRAAGPESADLILINTCTVRQKPEEKVYSQLGRYRMLKERNPALLIGVMGCMAQKEGEALRKRAPFVDLVVGPRQLGRIPDLVERVRAEGKPLVEVSQDLRGEPPLALIPTETLLQVQTGTREAGRQGGGNGVTAFPPSRFLDVTASPPSRSLDENASPPSRSLDVTASPPPRLPGPSLGLSWDDSVAAPRNGALAPEDDLTAGFAPVGMLPSRRLKPFVSVIQGCNYRCTYCIVPLVRGREYSRPADDVVREVRWLVDNGFREVTLLGQNILSWGNDLGPAWDFPRLLELVSEVEGLDRIRYTSSHPREVTDRLIEAHATLPKVCEHVHLPLQAADDTLLKRMARGHTVAYYEETIAKLRARVPGIAVTSDLIVGFPGETEAHVENYLAGYRRLRFDQAYMFAYSPRPGTVGATLPDQIERPRQIERLERVIAQQNAISGEVNRALEGATAEVLVEGPSEKDPGKLTGRTRTNKPVVFPVPPGMEDEALVNELVAVRLTKGHLWGLEGELLTAVSSVTCQV